MTSKRDSVIALRTSSGALTASEVSNALDTKGYSSAVVHFDFTLLTLDNAGDQLDFYLQTKYDGINWVDLENIHFDNGDDGDEPLQRVMSIGGAASIPLAADLAITPTDGTLADDTKVKMPLGAEIRIKVVLVLGDAPIYTYSAVAYLTE